MPDIEFTQYLRLSGRQQSVWVDRPDMIATKARALVAEGYRLEIEVLSTGTISMTVDNGDDLLLAIQLCENGPVVPETVDALVTEAYDRMLAQPR